MIAANELRLGNALEYLVEDCVDNSSEWMLNIVDTADIVDAASNESIFNKYYRPIPLTPEILEKCGLKNGNSELDRNVFYSTNKHLAQFSVNISGSFGIYVGVFIALRSVHLEYLHQLQNLYWCLCGEELNYTI